MIVPTPPTKSADPARRWLRWLPAVVVGALAGVPLGLRIGYCTSAPLFGSNSDLAAQGFLLLGATAIVVVILVIWAAARWTAPPLVAACALVAAGVLGANLAPSAPGSSQSASGSGSAGTRQDPTAFWSGSVTCHWQQGDSSVTSIDGWNVAISDAKVLTTIGLNRGEKVVTIFLGFRLTNTAMVDGLAPSGETRNGADLALENVTGQGRGGTAVASGEVIVFTWSCSRGP